jgi:hypothetical protein
MTELVYTAIGLGLVGAIFCGVYLTNRERLWWAIIPGIGALTLLVALLVDSVVGTDPANDWTAGFVVAAGAAIIALVLQRPDARRVLAIIAVFALAIGILMTPLDVVLKIVLAGIVVIAAGIALFGTRGHSTTLRPH